MLIFKVDFEKAFDSVSWRYLDYVLLSLGFHSKWRSWIRASLQSSRSSILINGLHGAMSNAVNSGLIRVSNDEVSSMASRTGCAAGSFPFTYLRLPIGSNMNLTSSWNILVERFQKRLSSWKANLLSIGGYLPLIKAVIGSLRIYYLSSFKAPRVILKSLERLRSRFFWGGSQDAKSLVWVKWSNVLPSFKKGGMHIGSLKAFNLSLLQKWRWRLFSSLNAHWVKVIKALHDQEGGLDHQEIIAINLDTSSDNMTRFLALGWHLEEIHVTWAHLEKKQTRLRLYTKSLKKYTKIDISYAAGGNLRRLSAEEAWETIEDYAFDEPIGDMEDKEDNPSPQSTPKVLSSIELYTSPVTYPKEVEETIGIPMEVEPLDHIKLEDLGLNTNTHDLFLSSKGFSSVDEPEP
ncbi:hypothetical protein Tco_1407566 [Tanacetum coccineum]